MLTPRGEGFTPKRALIDKLNDALELVEQIAHPLANKRGNVGRASTCIVKIALNFEVLTASDKIRG